MIMSSTVGYALRTMSHRNDYDLIGAQSAPYRLIR